MTDDTDPRLAALARIIVSPPEGYEPSTEEHIRRAELVLWEAVRVADATRRERNSDEPSSSPVNEVIEDVLKGIDDTFPPEEARELLEDMISRRPTGFDTTDLANAGRLVTAHGRDLRYVTEWGWMAWDGRRWVQDEGRVQEAAKTVSAIVAAEARKYGDPTDLLASFERMLKETKAKDDPDPKEVKGLEKKVARLKAEVAHYRSLMAWANKSEAVSRIAAMVTLAQSDPRIRAKAEDFDAHPWLLNVQNGTIDLETGELRPHNREDLLTKLVPVAYDLGAKAPRFERFVSEVMGGNDNLVAYLRRVAGYVLTGSVDERAFIILYGRLGSNGKSLFGEVLSAALGDYATTVPSNVLMTERSGGGKHRATPELAKLKGVRLASASEGQAGQQIDTGQLKEWAGDEKLTARELYRQPVEFMPQFKLLFRTNFLPKMSPSDHAAWNRVHVVPFTQQFERDPTLKGILLGELPGILAWAVSGAMEWKQSGLAPPAEVTDAVAEYRRELDVVGRFLEERTRKEPGDSEGAQVLYKTYVDWCESGHEQPWRYRAFAKDLEDRGYLREHTEKGTVFPGLVLSAHDVDQAAGGWRRTTYTPARGGSDDDI